MRFKTTYRLFVAVCLVGFVIWSVERHIQSTDERRDSSTRVLNVTAEDVCLLLVTHGEPRFDCVKKNGIWDVVHPIATRADDGAVTRILHEIEAMRRQEVVTAQQRKERHLSLNDYGFDKPRARLVIGDIFGRKNELLIGCDAPLGDFVYVKLADSEEVISTQRSILESIPDKIEDLRDKIIVHGDVARTTRIEINSKAGGFIQLMQPGKGWLLQQPEVARADNDKVSEILHSLYVLRATNFVWDVPRPVRTDNQPETEPGETAQSSAKMEACGLSDEAAVRVTVWLQGDETGRGLIIGKPVTDHNDQVYAKNRDSDSIYAVAKDLTTVFSVTANDLKDRNLYSMEPEQIKTVCFQSEDKRVVLSRSQESGWTITEPGQWKADDQIVDGLVRRITHLRIESFADASKTNLTELGLAPPAYTIRMVCDKTDATGCGTNCLLVGVQPIGKSSIFVKFDNEKSIYELSLDSMKGLEMNPADPLLCRDRTILAIEPAGIKRLTLVKNGVSQTVQKDPSGTWSSSVPGTNRVDESAMDATLLSLANLRALRIECNSPKSVVSYGLDHPTAALTIGLSGNESVQKTLLIGFLAGTDGMFSMVQGQDVVFVLDKPTAANLMADLIVPSTQAGTGIEKAGKPGRN